MAEQEQDRSEQATAYKISKAREKGMVPRSLEVNTALAVAAFLAFLHFWGVDAARRVAGLAAYLLRHAHALAFGDADVPVWTTASMLSVLSAVLPLLGMVVAAALASALAQFGLVFTSQPLKPDWQRLNPVAGFKRIFSKRALFETVKNLFKLVLFGGVLALTLQGLADGLLGLSFMSGSGHAGYLLKASRWLILYLLLAMAAVAVADLVFVRRDHARQLMMSRREIRDEVKHREGDPKIKARIRELRAEMRQKSRAIREVPDADVLITNPTHLAVALRYRHGEMSAPRVVAKGAGEQVASMKTLARRHGVMIVENRPLARALYKQQLNASVPEAHYADVARILIWVQEARRLRNRAQEPSTS